MFRVLGQLKIKLNIGVIIREFAPAVAIRTTSNTAFSNALTLRRSVKVSLTLRIGSLRVHHIGSCYIAVHPDHCRWQTICATFSDFDLDIHIERLPDICAYVIFVDGSSVAPSIPLQSFAAWAMVVDRATDDSARIVFADKYSSHHELPEPLMHSFSGRVAGCQSNQ